MNFYVQSFIDCLLQSNFLLFSNKQYWNKLISILSCLTFCNKEKRETKYHKEYEKLKNSLIFLGLFDENLLKENKNIDNLSISEDKINELIEKRKSAKQNKNWDECDRIRDYLKEHGILLKDGKGETSWEAMK